MWHTSPTKANGVDPGARARARSYVRKLPMRKFRFQYYHQARIEIDLVIIVLPLRSHCTNASLNQRERATAPPSVASKQQNQQQQKTHTQHAHITRAMRPTHHSVTLRRTAGPSGAEKLVRARALTAIASPPRHANRPAQRDCRVAVASPHRARVRARRRAI